MVTFQAQRDDGDQTILELHVDSSFFTSLGTQEFETDNTNDRWSLGGTDTIRFNEGQEIEINVANVSSRALPLMESDRFNKFAIARMSGL